MFVSAILLVVPGTLTDVVGFVVLAVIFALKLIENKKKVSCN